MTDARIEALRRAIADVVVGDGPGIVDEVAEERRAPIRAHALRLLDQRARSREELRGRLAADPDRDPADIEAVLDALQESRLLDDVAFAAEWVRQRARRRGKSRRALNRELADKGIDAGIRAGALGQLSDDDERRTAEALAVKKARTIRAVPAGREARDRDLRRVVGVLARRGFPQSMSMDIARAALDARYAELAGE